MARDDDFPCGAFDPVSRRRFLGELSLGMGAAALGTLLVPGGVLGQAAGGGGSAVVGGDPGPLGRAPSE